MKNKNIFILFLSLSLLGKTDGTTGLPLGGVGTGAIKYSACSGKFTANFRTPTRNGDYQNLPNTQFQLFTQRGDSILTCALLKAQEINGRVDDDAVFPLHWVNFGKWNNVGVKMTAYLPYYPDSLPLLCHPGATFEFTVENLESSYVTVAIAFQINTPITPVGIPDTGLLASDSSLELCLIGKIHNGSGNLTYGNDTGFFTSGLCNNTLTGTTNRVAIRVSLSSYEKRSLRFILAWYKPNEKEHYQYTNFWNNAKEVAISALHNFDAFKSKAEELVLRMRSSNLPEWLIDQTLNSTINLINNSVYFQDGRYCHTEGQWSPEGTMDQMWHARQIYTMINPNLAWQELKWWARTQHIMNYPGQIHHDFGTNFNYCEWDDTEHPDYRPIYEWVDLNCGFIISVYEAFIATADLDKLSYFWPYLKKAGERILTQVQLYGSSEYPYTFESSLSTYDAGGNSQAYNTGLSIVAYQIMSYLAKIMGEVEIASIYQNAFEVAVENFEKRWLDNTYPCGIYCESALGGPWIANFLKFDPFWEKQKLDALYYTLFNYYDPLNKGLGYPNGSYSEWQPYLVGHFGGFSLQTRRSNIWLRLQKDMYERNYLNRNLVFNEQLGIPPKVSLPTWIATSSSGTNQYISIPVLWRNYYNLIGFHYNKYSKELWLEPILFDSLNHELQNALIITPDGYAKISYTTYGDSYQNQQIVFIPDNSIEVSSIYVWDLYTDSIDIVQVNGIKTTYLRTGNGDQSHLKINWSGTITNSGITIKIEGKAKPSIGIPEPPENLRGLTLNSSQILLSWSPVEGENIGYIVEINTKEGFKTLDTTSDTSYLETGLLKNTAYKYRIRSYNTQHISNPTNELLVTTKDGGNGEVIFAINSGGETYLSKDGIEYINDATTGWVSGGSIYSTTNPIEGTLDDKLYQSERYGDFSYNIPLENGFYELVLKFAEIYWENPGSRIFHVEAEGEHLIRNLDLLFRTEKNTAYDVVIPVELKDGELNINFITKINNAKLSAMEIRKGEGNVNNPDSSQIPKQYFIKQNYPNPFNSITNIDFGLPEETQVKITIYNLIGEKLAIILDEKKEAGYHSITFSGANLPKGVYFYKIEANNFSQTKKLILIK
ncbi:MAG: malectin domain-containing carbohydrate-binding protein [candidate division WOR-3 bacterium]